MGVLLVSILLIFELTQQIFLVNFMLFLNVLKDKLIASRTLFTLKLYELNANNHD